MKLHLANTGQRRGQLQCVIFKSTFKRGNATRLRGSTASDWLRAARQQTFVQSRFRKRGDETQSVYQGKYLKYKGKYAGQ